MTTKQKREYVIVRFNDLYTPTGFNVKCQVMQTKDDTHLTVKVNAALLPVVKVGNEWQLDFKRKREALLDTVRRADSLANGLQSLRE